VYCTVKHVQWQPQANQKTLVVLGGTLWMDWKGVPLSHYPIPGAMLIVFDKRATNTSGVSTRGGDSSGCSDAAPADRTGRAVFMAG